MNKRFITFILFLMLLPAVAFADIFINEVMASNGTYESGHAYDWIELYNSGSHTVDLSGWGLSDSGKDLYKWCFPSGTKLKSGAYLTVFCTGQEMSPGSASTFYSNFKISASGETLHLTDSEGNQQQKLKLPAQYGCISYGRSSESGEYGFFENDTRGKKNAKTVLEKRADAPEIITPGGFYSSEGVVIQLHSDAQTVVRYTTDGSTPNEKSSIFPSDGLLIKKTTVLRIKAFADNCVSSETVSASYFINDDPLTPIVSLVTDDAYLFNKKTGALVKGTGSIPNYSKGFEYPINIEYFTVDGSCLINQMGTFTCSGHSARINAQKSIALYARKAYGNDSFAFNPFPTRDYTSYHSLLLRAANSDTTATRLRDIVASSLAQGQGILYQDYVVVQVYINGEYWGHYNLREKINKYFIAQYEQVSTNDIDNIDILARTGSDDFVQNGSNTDWLELCNFCKKKNLNDPDNLQYVIDRLDIDSLFTHAAFEIILGNVDFTNVRVYRVPGGKWKYLLFDVQACWRGLDKTPLEYYIKPVTAKIQGFRHEPLNALLAVPEMKARFLNRVAELLEECFQWPYVESKFNHVIEQLEPILPRHISRWKNMKLSDWKKNISATEYYARVRPRKIPSLLKTAMKLTDAEVELYFGDVLRLLEVTNAKPE